MKNPFKNTTFLFGVTKYQNLPEDIGTEIILSGRSNAGKSSALNAITQNRKLARISKTPGRTTEINFFQVEENFKLLDLPGYGYAKLSKDSIKKINSTLENYFLKRKQLLAAFVLIDIRHDCFEIDLNFMKWLNKNLIPFDIIFTKADKLKSCEIEIYKGKYINLSLIHI